MQVNHSKSTDLAPISNNNETILDNLRQADQQVARLDRNINRINRLFSCDASQVKLTDPVTLPECQHTVNRTTIIQRDDNNEFWLCLNCNYANEIIVDNKILQGTAQRLIEVIKIYNQLLKK